MWPSVAVPGLAVASWRQGLGGFSGLSPSVELVLTIAELSAVAWLLLSVRLGGRLALRGQVGYDAVVTFCQSRGLSLAELGSLVTFIGGYVMFDLFVTLAEDDTFEAISFVFSSVIAAAVCLLVLAVDVQYYYMISAVSGGEATLRVFYTDVVNNGLCLLRIFFC